MVEFYKDTDPAPEGPCRKIMRRERDFIREMVAETERTGKERIAYVVEIRGGMAHTDPIEGNEAAITKETASRAMMDSLGLQVEMDDRAGKTHQNDGARHQIHTHPNGFAGLSTTDVKSYAEDIQSGDDNPDSSLTATMTEDGIVLGGLYLTEEITDEDKAELRRATSLASSDKLVLMDPTNDDESMLIDTLESVGAEFCSVLFPER